MAFNSVVAMSEIEWRYEFVLEGVQSARWLRQQATERLCARGDRLAQAAGKALVVAGTWLQQERLLRSARS